MIFTYKEYLKHNPIESPYIRKNGDSFDFSVACNKCHKPTECMRGYWQQHENCDEIRCAGICKPCNLLNSFHARIHDDDRVTIQTSNGWMDVKLKPSPNWKSILEFWTEKIKQLFAR